MSTILSLLGKVLGLGPDMSAISVVTGIINNASLLPIALWGWTHRDEIIDFKLSLGTLAVIVLVALFYLEILRRSQPRNGASDHG